MKALIDTLRFLRSLLQLPVLTLQLLQAVYQFKFTNTNDSSAYFAMIKAFSITGGITNSLACKLLAQSRQHFPRKGILDCIENYNENKMVVELRQKGYLLFPQLISEQVCDELLNFALHLRGLANRLDEGDVAQPNDGLYKRSEPTSLKFSYEASDIIQSHIIQNILVDNSILRLVQDYLGSAPIVDILAMWWSSSFKKIPDKESAQFWHFDMDRPKWLKLFIYLTDVDCENGPHSFIEGSHRNGGIPYVLRSKGYVRLSDAEVARHFRRDRMIKFTGKKGTVILEDTRGLHKGHLVTAGDRLMLQFEFSSSLFGAKYTPIRIPSSQTNLFCRQLEETPVVFAGFEKK